MVAENKRRFLRGAGLGVLAGLALLLAWLVLAGLVGGYHALSLRSAAAAAQEQLDEGDQGAAAESVADIGRHSAGLGRWLGGAPWGWFTDAPVVGPTISAAVTLSGGSAAVLTPVAPAGASLLQADAADMTAVAAQLAEQSPALAEGAAAALRWEPEVAAIDPDQVLGPLRGAVATAQEQFIGAVPAITGAAAGSVLLPGLLGVGEPTEWVLLASQPAEARGSGAGFWGAFGIMRAADGSLELSGRSNDEIFDVPVALDSLPPSFAALWGESASFIWGHNLTRNYPYAAQLMRESVAGLGVSADYVVALDPRVVAALLELTGPISAAGVTLEASSAEQFLTSDIYTRFPDSGAKDAVVLGLMSELFVTLQETSLPPAELFEVLAEPLSQQRLVVWAADPAQQELVAASVIGGQVPTAGSVATVALNNAAAGKMDAYVDSAITYEVIGDCAADELPGRIAVELAIDVPVGLPDYVTARFDGDGPYGSSSLFVHVYGPPGAVLESYRVDGQEIAPVTGVERNHPVWGAKVELRPGATAVVEVDFRQASYSGDQLELLVQPMIRDTEATVIDGRDCGADR